MSGSFRNIIIGDVHGCLDELRELVGVLQPRDYDKLFFIGDLIDRGPRVAETLRYVRELTGRYRVILILGNHEEKFMRFVHYRNTANVTARLMRGVDGYENLLSQVRDDDVQFLSKSYYSYRIEGTPYVVIHGGIPLDNNVDLSANIEYRWRSSKERRGLDALLRTRYVDSEGKPVTFGEGSEDARLWAETYDGRHGVVIFGHEPFLQSQPKMFRHALGIDTGCVFGGWLTAFILQDGKEPHSVSVKAEKQYVEIDTEQSLP
jgi:diadenosine tetraphosphatase ApaH/serine/threonine PP2A family protein phosphatase